LAFLIDGLLKIDSFGFICDLWLLLSLNAHFKFKPRTSGLDAKVLSRLAVCTRFTNFSTQKCFSSLHPKAQ
jgi:hypothetical protein